MRVQWYFCRWIVEEISIQGIHCRDMEDEVLAFPISTFECTSRDFWTIKARYALRVAEYHSTMDLIVISAKMVSLEELIEKIVLALSAPTRLLGVPIRYCTTCLIAFPQSKGLISSEYIAYKPKNLDSWNLISQPRTNGWSGKSARHKSTARASALH